VVDSSDLAQVIAEAEDIAGSVGHRLTSAHLLLALFTVANRAQVLLRDKGVDEDSILGLMTAAPTEPDSLARELLERTRELALSTSSAEADCLHLLIAMTRLRCAAQDLLARSKLELSQLRNTALSFYTGGHMPRRLQNLTPQPALSRVAPRPSLFAPVAPAPVATPAPALPQRQVEAEEELEAELQPETVATPNPAPAPAPSLARPATGGVLASKELDPKQFPWLAGIGRNLTALAARGALDPVIGREKEIDEVVDILGKRRTNNPCLLGEPGVGKTAVVEGVAQALLKSRSSGDRVVIELDMASVVAGTQLRGSFSEKLNAIKEEVKKANGRVVVFIDELHTVVGAGSTGDGPQDAANELKAALARGEFPCIGATTHDEWRKFIATDPALERRFTAVMVNEPTVAQTTQILEGVVERYARHHGLRYHPEALSTAAQLAARYVSDRFLPDKAISIVDLAGSRCAREGKHDVTAVDVARVVAKLAGIPEERLLMKDTERLLRLEDELQNKVIGHRPAIERIAKVVRRNYAGFGTHRPMGSFLFLGPTGVGKTEMAKALAEVLFGSSDALCRVDMSELAESHGVAKLVGAPPGYVGYGEGGQLTEPVRRRPSCVVLLDEIEKAHREVLLLLLQVLDEGRLTDGRGRHIDFSNTVVVLTSNLGAAAFGKAASPVGFGSQAASGAAGDRALDQAKQSLPPELWNRIDERLIFQPLAREEIARIATLLLAESSKRLFTEKGIQYAADAEVIAHLIEHGGFDQSLGARPMRQTVQRLIEAPLAEEILSGQFGRGDSIRVGLADEKIAFKSA
jgi:ATP-dependent Clp protease ATP-binding subunit ClpC